jgi:glycine cleavage system aminomethyltransferase T
MGAQALRALRESVAVSVRTHVVPVRVAGPAAFDALDRLVSGDLYVQAGRMRHSLLLREDGTPLADVYVCAEEDGFVLLAEGPDGPALLEHLRAHGGGPGLELALLEDRAVVGMDGPYAWELASGVLGPDPMGLPFLSSAQLDGIGCYRAGKTGEYGFDLLVPRAEVAAWEARLLEAGRPLDVARAGLEDLDHCALENWFFNVRREGRSGATPLELQLQWRVSRRKAYVGSAALAARRASGLRERLVCVAGPGPLVPGDPVLRDGHAVGRIVNAGACAPRGEWVATALLELDLAHAGLDGFEADGAGGRSGLRTVSPPLLNNRSLYVQPQRHGYATRAEVSWPSLA